MMIIDVHGHVTSPELLRRLPMPPSLGDIDGMIEQKLALGITTTIVGSPVGYGTMVPAPGWDNDNQPLDKLEGFHDWLAETVRERPRQLRAYAYANPFGSDAQLDEASRRLEQDEFVGLIVNTSVRGRLLGDPAADAFFAMAAQHRAPVLLHPPAEPIGGAALGHLGLVEHVGRPCDVTVGVASIIFAGWLDKYPALRLIVSNAGGALPILREKLDLAQRRIGPSPARRTAAGPPTVADTVPASETLRRLYVDTATPSRTALRAALEAFGPGRLLFGTDTPPLTGSLADAVERVDDLPTSPTERDAVRSGNALALFGLDTPVPVTQGSSRG